MTHRLRTLAGALLTCVVTGSLLAAVTSPADASSDATGRAAAAAASARPQVGDCHLLTETQSNTGQDGRPPISCERKHTSRTIAVKDVEASAFRNKATVNRTALRVCVPTYNRTLGGSGADRALTAYGVVPLVPTRAQLRAGARWIRCDLILVGGTRLLSLPTDDVPAIGAAPHPSRIALCAQITSRTQLTTACSVKHNYRAEGAFQLPSGPYPGRARIATAADRSCPRVSGSSEAFYYLYPSADQWNRAKVRHVACLYANRR